MRKKITRQRSKPSNRVGEVLGILLIGISSFIFLALISYEPMDISLNAAQPNDPSHNYIGLVGAWFSFATLFIMGLASFLIPFFIGFLGVRAIFKGTLDKFWTWMGLVFINLVSFSCLLELGWELKLAKWVQHFGLLQLGPGGILGEWLARRLLVKLIGIEGSYIVLYSAFLATLVFLIEIRLTKTGRVLIFYLTHFVKFMGSSAKRGFIFLREYFSSLKLPKKSLEKENPLVTSPKGRESILYPDELEVKVKKKEPKPIPVEERKSLSPLKEPPAKEETRIQLELISQGDYELPSIKLLEDAYALDSDGSGQDDLQRNAEILKTTLQDFGVEVEVVNITQGPVITRYELQPAPGVKVQRITGLSNDIALAMKVGSVRILAPIPGKAAVGIEIPNTTSSMVTLKDLLSSEEFKNAHKYIPLVLGKDVSGVPIIADLTEMPHLLIAGATGSGKSICINSIILNILYYASPEYIRFLMVDPKRVELSMYNGIPHLAVPVITDAKKAAGGLAWLVSEMERRYKILAEIGVRNIESFNEKVIKEKVTLRSSEEPLKPLPYIVVIIDELADIMMVSSYEVENSIARLAQLSRAIGIHLIIATQRPSVDVITGVIKANFPARISFQVSSKVDSRTVIDGIGAEKLLGKGDMLYMPPGSSKLIRAQGAFVRDLEIRRVLDFIKGQNVSFNSVINPEEIMEKTKDASADLNQMDDETLTEEAIKVIRNTNQASVSILQRKLKIGYSRAARIMDLLEEKGIVGPYKGSKARDILIDIQAEEIN